MSCVIYDILRHTSSLLMVWGPKLSSSDVSACCICLLVLLLLPTACIAMVIVTERERACEEIVSRLSRIESIID